MEHGEDKLPVTVGRLLAIKAAIRKRIAVNGTAMVGKTVLKLSAGQDLGERFYRGAWGQWIVFRKAAIDFAAETVRQ